MRVDRSKVFIGFKRYLCNLDSLGSFGSAEAKALHQLTKGGYPPLPGLIRVTRRLKYLNAVAIQIDPKYFDAFLSEAAKHDPIEYCDVNYALKLADFAESIAEDFRTGTPFGKLVRRFHLSASADNDSLGVGVRVGLIDSGLTPHPILPALSATELRAKSRLMHWSIPSDERDRLCAQLTAAESKSRGATIGSAKRPTPITPSSPQPMDDSDFPDLYHAATKSADRYAEDQWTGWEHAMAAWISGGRQTSAPAIPCLPNLFGQFRMISPLSRSFLTSELSFGIGDVVGHGTQMAAFIAGLPTSLDLTNAQSPPNLRADIAGALELDTVGIAPFAELVVLKCCHDIDDADHTALDGWIETAIDALVYAIDNEIDVIYFGFAIHDSDPTTVSAINSYLQILEQRGCIVVAPAGNEVHPSGLGFPAASPYVRAIASVTIDPLSTSGVSRASYSSMANPKPKLLQKVAFSAFGGDIANPLLSSDLRFGYSHVSGTSVSAAIAAGIYAAEASAYTIEQFRHHYHATLAGQLELADVPQLRSNFSTWKVPRRPAVNADTVLQGKVGVCDGVGEPDAVNKVGRGLIRI